ncbi:hypothetical protein VC895_09035 [Citrobacter freundii]|uniref:hypothetical protein n=1 Tax=Citrobacter freundii TaxID=546 RepID=UPI0010648C77|nr:hypothetical protein [Citrobacter freundii]MDT7135192.1 hypothetical protein [Citrobacter freundii]MEB0960124.1 hypothetical protein [Citrobacter freundii]HAU5769805.1 hypothetical protein [Citrobacter freundii]HAU5813244.1 hypothetical protein [Citrobacter freundii]
MWIVLTRLFAGSIKPGTDCVFFPSLAHFSATSAGSIQEEIMLRRSNLDRKGILKVLSNGTINAYLTCHEGFKDENYS